MHACHFLFCLKGIDSFLQQYGFLLVLKCFFFFLVCYREYSCVLKSMHLHTRIATHTCCSPLFMSSLSNLMAVTPSHSTWALILFVWNGALCAFLSKRLRTKPICCEAGMASSIVKGQVHPWCQSNNYTSWVWFCAWLEKCDLKSADEYNRNRKHKQTFCSQWASYKHLRRYCEDYGHTNSPDQHLRGISKAASP